MELDAGLIEKRTPAFAYALAQGHAKAPIRIVERGLRATSHSAMPRHVAPPGKGVGKIHWHAHGTLGEPRSSAKGSSD